MRMRALAQSLIAMMVGAAGALASGLSRADDFDDLVNATAIHCEFFPSVRPADAPVARAGAMRGSTRRKGAVDSAGSHLLRLDQDRLLIEHHHALSCLLHCRLIDQRLTQVLNLS